MRQETEQILATSRRLLQEMQVLLETASKLAEQNETLFSDIAERRRKDSEARAETAESQEDGLAPAPSVTNENPAAPRIPSSA